MNFNKGKIQFLKCLLSQFQKLILKNQMIKIFINEIINNKGEQLLTEKMQLPIFSKTMKE